MKGLIRRAPDGSVAFVRWPHWVHETLLLLPDLAAPDVRGPAQERLYPVPGPGEAAAEWRRNVHPELFALLASARDVVAADLVGARIGKLGTLLELKVPAAHLPGWIAALNAARLRIAAEAGVDGRTMATDIDDLPEALREPVALLDFFGFLQQTLIGGADPESVEPPPGAAG